MHERASMLAASWQSPQTLSHTLEPLRLEDRVQQVIVAGIVAVAEAMSIRVVAEYVEDAETAGLLRELGVSFAQGYAIGRPRRWNVPGTAG